MGAGAGAGRGARAGVNPLQLVDDTTVVIPTHPGRAPAMLTRALLSCRQQTIPPADVIVQADTAGAGAAETRGAGLRKVRTGWVAFLDSDDWFYPQHLEFLALCALETGADYTYSYFTVHDAWEAARPDIDPLGLFGRPFDPANPSQTTTTILVRAELAQAIGFQTQPVGRLIDGTNLRHGEDYEFTLNCIAAGATIVHLPARTWAWRHHGLNTGGVPGHGDAR